MPHRELHPIIVVVEPSGGGVAHSLVLVRLDRDLRPRSDGLFELDGWPQVPLDLLEDLQLRIDDPDGLDGDLVAVDPVGLAVSLGTTSTRGVLPVEQVYPIVTDPAVAEEVVFAAIEAGDLPTLSAILPAAPELQTRPTAWGLAVSVLLLAQNEPDQVHQFGRQVAEQATAIQRRAHTIRLRALRSHHPDLPGLDDLIQIIDPETPAS